MTQVASSIINGAAFLIRGLYDGKNKYDWAMQTLIHGVEFLRKVPLQRRRVRDPGAVLVVKSAQRTVHVSAMSADAVCLRIALHSHVSQQTLSPRRSKRTRQLSARAFNGNAPV